jgi:uncharacterized RDD family membrane protein YckC
MKLAPDAARQVYPSIPARIKAGEIDALIIVGFLFVLIGSYVAIGRQTPAIIFISIAVLLLYEPVLVTWRGQTIGHKIMGFRIIDSVTRARISFSKSLARLVLKAVFGVVSVIWAFFEQRQQFLHDKMTRSLAVMCEVPADQVGIQPAPSVLGSGAGDFVATLSLRRRVAFIVLYAIGAFILLITIEAIMFPGCVSDSPISPEQCHIIDSITGGLFFVLLSSIITAGLRGGLPGARKISATN